MDNHDLVEIVRGQAIERGDDTMLVLGAERRSWAEQRRRAARVAHALTAAGVGVGHRVAVIDKNGMEYFDLLFGAWMVGAVPVAVNWRLTATEMTYILDDAEAEVIVVHADFFDHLDGIEAAKKGSPRILTIGAHPVHTTFEDWIADQPEDDPGRIPAPDDVALQLYTSGTTGHPKGAQITHANLVALIDAAAGWEMDHTSVSLTAMPLFHIGGAGWGLFGLAKGALVVLMREVDPMAVLGVIEEHRVTHAFLVPAVLQFLLIVPDASSRDLSSMQLMLYGASPISEEVLVGSMGQFGCDFAQLYGLTETTGAVVMLEPDDHVIGSDLLRSAGRAMPGIELRIVDPETGDEVADGEVGEVWIRGPLVMAGYWKMPEATAESLPGDGWFRSGDAGYLRDGYLFIHDRVKDMIISGGENVYPAEVENVLMGHPSVADVAVIGVPDDRWGETPKAMIVPTPGVDLDEADIIAHCRAQLAAFKCPTSVTLVEVLPRNPSGKVLKRELRAPYWGEGRQVS